MNAHTAHEARIRHLEESLRMMGDVLARLQDQVGQVAQDQRMTRVPFGSGAGPRSMSAVVATEIAAAPDADTLGQGTAVLRNRDGAALADGKTVTVFSNFSAAIPVGTRIEVEPDGTDYKLVGSDCPAA